MRATTMQIDGVDLHIEGTGPETIVMIHGWPDTYRLWDGTVAALKDRYRCVRFTLPGFVAPQQRRGYPMDELMALVGKIVDAANPGGKVTLMVHDWGCVIGYQYCARHPERVARVIGVDIGDARSLRREIAPAAMVAVLAYQLFLAAAWKIGGRIGDRMTRWMARRMRCPSDFAPISSAMTWPYWMTWFGGWRGDIREFRPACPMLYLYARRKPFMFHAQSWLEFLRQDPRNRIEPFDTNHWVMLQQPERFNQVVGDWLAGGVKA